MKMPTPEEIAAAKADAAARFGRDAVLLVALTGTIDACLLVAPLDLKAWSKHVDAQVRDLVTSHQSLALSQRVWPSVEATLDILKRRPAAAKKISLQLYKRAGQAPGDPRVELLSDLVASASGNGEVIPGLSLAKALRLLEEAAKVDEGEEPRELWAAWGPGPLSVVLTTPDPDVWLAASTADARARAKGERIAEATLDFAKQEVVWSQRPLDELFDDVPAITTDLKEAYRLIGGEGAEATSKSL